MAETVQAQAGEPVRSCALALPEQVNINNVAEVMASLEGACRAERQSSAPHCGVDLSRLKEFDSTVLSMLLEVGRHAGKPLAVVNPPPKLVALAQLYGVSELVLSSAGAGECA